MILSIIHFVYSAENLYDDDIYFISNQQQKEYVSNTEMEFLLPIIHRIVISRSKKVRTGDNIENTMLLTFI